MIKMVLASKNRHKLEEIRDIVKELDIQLISMEYGVPIIMGAL